MITLILLGALLILIIGAIVLFTVFSPAAIILLILIMIDGFVLSRIFRKRGGKKNEGS